MSMAGSEIFSVEKTSILALFFIVADALFLLHVYLEVAVLLHGTEVLVSLLLAPLGDVGFGTLVGRENLHHIVGTDGADRFLRFEERSRAGCAPCIYRFSYCHCS